jgi:hypothetical protein
MEVGVRKMKTITNILLTMFLVTGLCLAGAECESITRQFIGCSVGFMMFAASAYGLSRVNGGNHVSR